MLKLSPKKIAVENGWNPRTDFSGETELMNSIIENGVLNPVHVCKSDSGYTLVDGERRLRACLRAEELGHDIFIPAIVEEYENDADKMLVSLLTNTGKNLLPAEEGIAFKKLSDWGWAVDRIAKMVAKSGEYIRQRLLLVDSHKMVSDAVKDGKITLKEMAVIVRASKGYMEQVSRLNDLLYSKNKVMPDTIMVAKKILKDIEDSYDKRTPETINLMTQIIDLLNKCKELLQNEN